MSNENKALMPINNKLPIEQKRNISRINDGFKRTGKIVLSGAATLAGVAIGGPVGFTVSVVSLANAVQETMYKRTKGSMFMTKKNIKGEISAWQDIWKLKNFSQLKGLIKEQKAAMMGLEILTHLDRYKQQFSDQNKITKPSRNGEYGVYTTVFTTKTHGINIKTIEALEKLGYLQIESKEPRNKSILLSEKITFKEYKEAKEAIIAKITLDKENIKKHEKQLYDIRLRLTDKPLDLEEIYKNYLEVRNTKGKNENRKSLRRIGIMFELLQDTNIDFERDSIGILQIKNNSEESFAKRIEKQIQQEDKNKQFRESLQEEIEPEMTQQPEKAQQQEIETLQTVGENKIQDGDERG